MLISNTIHVIGLYCSEMVSDNSDNVEFGHLDNHQPLRYLYFRLAASPTLCHLMTAFEQQKYT